MLLGLWVWLVGGVVVVDLLDDGVPCHHVVGVVQLELVLSL